MGGEGAKDERGVYKGFHQIDREGSSGGHLASWTRRWPLSSGQVAPTATHAAEHAAEGYRPNPKPNHPFCQF